MPSSKLYDTLTLPNTKSIARDYQASERTFLAYTRTALMLLGGGITVVQVLYIAEVAETLHPVRGLGLRAKVFAKPLGALLVGFAMVVQSLAVYRFFRLNRLLAVDKFEGTQLVLLLLTFIFGAIAATIFGTIFISCI